METAQVPWLGIASVISTSTIAVRTLVVSILSLRNSRRAQEFAESMKTLEAQRAQEANDREKRTADREERHADDTARLAAHQRQQSLVDDIMRWASGEFAKQESDARPRGDTVAELASITVRLEMSGLDGAALLARFLDRCDQVAPAIRGSDPARDAVAGIVLAACGMRSSAGSATRTPSRR